MQFFLNVNLATTSLFLRKYDVPVCSFVMTTTTTATGTSEENVCPVSSGPVCLMWFDSPSARQSSYSVRFRDLTNMRTKVRFVAQPFMNEQEVLATRRQAAATKSLPIFKIKEYR